MLNNFLELANPGAAPLESLPLLDFQVFRSALINAVLNKDMRVSAFFCWNAENERRIAAVLADDAAGRIRLASAPAPERYDSLTREVPAFHWFERELYEETGIVPEGHPWLKPIRFSTGSAGEEPAVTEYFKLGGQAAHEVAVGPVHAGVIEPGHFRFQCLGEDVHTLEISLGYQHRGAEKMLKGGPGIKTPFIIETISGDSSTAYAGAYAGIIEALSNHTEISRHDRLIRELAWELERIANHTGDLGALAGDVAFLQTQSFCGRIRGDFLNMTAAICGNRFGRGLVAPGGVKLDVDQQLAEKILASLEENGRNLLDATAQMFDAQSVLDRFENTGTVSRDTAKAIGLVGMAARASGIKVDIRATHPYGNYSKRNIIPTTDESFTGDVLARAEVRRRELEVSLELAKLNLKELAENNAPEKTQKALLECAPSSIAVSLVEGWRGEICHTAITDENGHFRRYKVVDPSFHNWFGLAMALRDGQISDFPICNKSFNLSYCGHDL